MVRKDNPMTNTTLQDIDALKLIYKEKQQTYNKLTDAYTQAMCAANEIRAMCDEAMNELHKAGEDIIRAMESAQ